MKKLTSSIQVVALRFYCPVIGESSIDLKDQKKIEQYKKRLKSYNPFH
ncbi:MAG: hypothetical protein K0M45_11935 [Candidatus Paracaedibacteraceae bacterium]|nr:hypothetical protein [Candidatus Paracaedibacteraceae bacterium]